MQEQNKKEWASSVGVCKKHKPQHPHHALVGVAAVHKQTPNITTLGGPEGTALAAVATFVRSHICWYGKPG